MQLPESVAREVEQQTEDRRRKLTRLTAERSAIDDQIGQVQQELTELETFVRVYQRFTNGSSPAPPANDATVANDGTDGSNRTLGRLEGVSVAEAAEMALRFLGGSAATGELRDLLVNRGGLRPDRNAYGYMMKILRSKPERFVNVARGRWALRQEVQMTR